MRSILFATFFLLAQFCWGQQSNVSAIESSLLDKSNLWSVLDNNQTIHINPSDPYPYSRSTWHQIGNDSIIKGITYKRLMKSTDTSHQYWTLSGFLRQTNSSVYFFDGNKEFLLYDFGLVVGSTFETDTNSNFNYISRLDSVKNTKINNADRKIYYLTKYPSSAIGMKVSETWIEGIGSITDGLLRQTTLGLTGNSHDYSLLCFHRNGELLYKSETYINCYYDIVNEIQEFVSSPNDFQILPNPSSGPITITNKTNDNALKVEIINSAGIVVKKLDSNLCSPIQFDLSDQKSGVYFIRIENKNEIVTKKIIKK